MLPTLSATVVAASLVLSSVTATGVPAPEPAAVTAPVALAAQTVYTLQPLNLNLIDSVSGALRGDLCRAPSHACIPVDYPAALGDWSIDSGAKNLAAVLDAHIGPAPVVFAYSEGAQAVTRYLNANPTAHTDVTYVLIGNPESSGGFRAHYGFAEATRSGIDGPVVIDIVRQYDGWADWPDRPTPLSVVNAVMGMSIVHNDYTGVSAPKSEAEIRDALSSDPDGNANLISRDGNVYRVLNRTDTLPITAPLTWIGMNSAAQKLSDTLRPEIEKAYDRPEQGAGVSDQSKSVEATSLLRAAAREQRTLSAKESASATRAAVREQARTKATERVRATAARVSAAVDRAVSRVKNTVRTAVKDASSKNRTAATSDAPTKRERPSK